NCTFTSNTSPNYGGAVYIDTSATPAFTGCTFQQNTAPIGGAILLDGSSPTFTTCAFNQNSSTSYAGVFVMYNAATLSVTNSTFNQNSTSCCGGVLANNGCNFNFTGCTFTGNSANYGATLWADGAGTPTITNCLFFGNTANNSGGAVHTTNSAAPTYTNCVFSGNRAQNGYGGVAYDLSSSAARFINCSAANNSAAPFAGGIWADGCTTTLGNSVFWQNSDANGMVQSSQLTNNNGATATINYTILQGWSGSLGGTANNGSNPQFTDPDGPDNIIGTPDDNLRPLPTLACIDSGNNALVPAGITTDAAGNARFANDPCVTDTGGGSPPIVDRGAYERIPLSQLLGDIDASGSVNLADVAPFVSVLLGTDTTPAHVAAADMNCDTAANGKDIAPFISKLLGP
ncbi:MAG TPA: right-handed parallel beta-helix repeat-containing protein, partial [Phycisphaerae bacterium]|nr:right-handed parallel beta-helix repeat-containing protein [Phycisphaerae bacterium]